MKVTGREIVSLLLVWAGSCTSVALVWPLYIHESLYTTREVKALLAASYIFLGLGTGIVFQHRLLYAVALLGVAVAATI